MKDEEIKLSLKGLDCANCANKIEQRVNDLTEVEEAILNFSLGTITIKKDDKYEKDNIIQKVEKIVKDLEPHVLVEEFKKNNIGPKRNVCTSDCCTSNHEEEHGHEHTHEKSNNKDKIVLAIGIAIYILAMILGEDKSYSIVLFVVSYVLVGGKVVLQAFRNMLKGEIFDENFLMTIATVGAFAIGQYPESVAVMVFYEIGELFQGYAVNKSRKSISELMDIKAEFATLLIDNKEEKVKPEQVKVNDIIIIKPGERIPLDGIIIEGETSLDTSALTGESLPRNAYKDEDILAGSINLTGVIKVKVTKDFGESTISRILELVQNASSKKAPTEKFITKFARYYTPAVVFAAVAVAIIPPLVITDAMFSDWLYRALIFLVVSCPCALVISVPLGLFAGIGGASKKGVLIKGGNYLEALKDVDTVVFDKTGTLTKGVFKVVKVNALDIEKEELLEVAALGESFSNHPIAKSIVNAYNKKINTELVKSYEEVSGNGIKFILKEKQVLLGNKKLMDKFNINYKEHDEIGTVIHVSIDGIYKGNIVIADEIKEDSIEAIKSLKSIGIKNTVMLTGDNKKVADDIARKIGITNVYSELLPGDKVEIIEKLINGNKGKGKVVFVGDGINDAPVLARADIGVAMGGIGSDAAIEAADVVLMKDETLALVDGINIAKRTNTILWQNIIFSLGVKIVVLILSAMGLANMWEGVFADVGVTLIAVFNSMRALKIK